MDIRKNIKDGEKSAEWDGFPVTPDGLYAALIDEGTAFVRKKDTPKGKPDDKGEYITIPFVMSGGEYDGNGVMLFINVTTADGKQSDFGERQLGDILYITEVAEAFAEKLKDGKNLFDKKIFKRMIKGLQVVLTGKKVIIKIVADDFGSKIVGIYPFDKTMKLGEGAHLEDGDKKKTTKKKTTKPKKEVVEPEPEEELEEELEEEVAEDEVDDTEETEAEEVETEETKDDEFDF